MARKPGSHSATTGPRIRAAALHLIATQGIEALSMRRIAAEVGLQAGALYTYFFDKQSLLADIVLSALKARQEACYEALVVASDPPAGLEAFVRFHLGWLRDETESARAAALDLRHLSDEGQAEARAMIAGYEAGLEAILEAGKVSGAFTFADTRLVTVAILSLLDGVAEELAREDRLAPDRGTRIAWNMVRKSVGA